MQNMSNKGVNLFCLPFAGGNKYCYREYEKQAPAYFNMVTLEYPGRGTRFNECLTRNMETLVDSLYEEIRPGLHENAFAFYGHSMGALVAFFLTRKIIAAGGPPPLHLFITGAMGPAAMNRQPKKRYLMSRKEFFEQIRDLDGCPAEILQNEDLLNFFEPILRADFEVSETYFYERQKTLDIPITVITGIAENMKPEDIRLWQQETSYKVDFRTMPGKHFFIFKFPVEIMAIVDEKLRAWQQLL